MDSMWLQVATQVPALAIFALLMRFIVKEFMVFQKSRDAMLENIGATCHEVQNRAIDAINENSKVLGEVSGLLSKLNGSRKL